ncbi:MAG TPA: DNA/RNA helicase domain-containing protein [Thermoanaerobaculia bacterium]|nr:DNA/RNA helicase domain-containing protein [Thermoanaerobaculia bacterium]
MSKRRGCKSFRIPRHLRQPDADRDTRRRWWQSPRCVAARADPSSTACRVLESDAPQAPGIDVRVDINPVKWFLEGKDHTRWSYYVENAATEFEMQGRELDGTCVTWDADYRFHRSGWGYHDFRGGRWMNVNNNYGEFNLTSLSLMRRRLLQVRTLPF